MLLLLGAQLSGSGLPTPLAPFTVAKQTALLTLFYDLLPPLFLGLGPQWTRVAAVASDAAVGTTNVSLLINSIIPPVWNDTSDSLPEVTEP